MNAEEKTRTRCPACGKVISVPTRLIGTRQKCPAKDCNAEFVVEELVEVAFKGHDLLPPDWGGKPVVPVAPSAIPVLMPATAPEWRQPEEVAPVAPVGPAAVPFLAPLKPPSTPLVTSHYPALIVLGSLNKAVAVILVILAGIWIIGNMVMLTFTNGAYGLLAALFVDTLTMACLAPVLVGLWATAEIINGFISIAQNSEKVAQLLERH